MSNAPITDQTQMEALLGRPLTEVEKNSYDLYLQIAIMRLDDLLCRKLEEMGEVPADLQLVLARCFAVIVQEQNVSAHHGINKKQVEDVSISYETNPDTPMEAFVALNSKVLDSYSLCQGPIRNGKVCCGYCL